MSTGRSGATAAIAVGLATALLGLAACEEETPAEQVGESVEESAESVGEAIEEGGDALEDSAE